MSHWSQFSIAVAFLAPSAVAAQWTDPANIDAYEAAAKRIVSARITPSPLHLAVGDTAVIKVELLDRGGEPIYVTRPDGKRGPPGFYLTGGGFYTVFAGSDVVSETVTIVGKRAASDARVMYPTAPFPRARGEPVTYAYLPVPITVGERAASRIEITAAPFEPYVGTSIPLSARVWKKGMPQYDPAPNVAWHSSDETVARVSPAGTVTLLQAGPVTITAANGGLEEAISFDVRAPAVSRIILESPTTEVRTGDVVRLRVRVLDARGAELPRPRVNLAVSSDHAINARAGATAYDDGTFVAEVQGVYTVVAELGGVAARTTIHATPRNLETEPIVVSHTSRKSNATTEIMVFEGRNGRDYALLGSFGETGAWVMVYDVTDPTNPVATDSIWTDARAVNDVRVDQVKGARLAVFTKEGAPNRKNGFVLLDLADPAHPRQVSEYTATTAAGVHNVWIYRNRVYLTNDGTGDMHIVDITDPSKPFESGRWSTGTPGRFLHDLIVEDGIAYLAYWDDGLVILDVGGAGKAGTLDQPVFVSRYAYGPGGRTHHAMRYKQYVFLADEGPEFIPRPANGPRGYVHVVDVSDLEHPREVAKYYPTEAGAHNVWLEEDRLYIAYYQGGLRVVDVSGELRGDLYQQGRQVAWVHTRGGPADYAMTEAFAWSPQVHKGHIFVSDMLSGMWIVKLAPKQSLTP